MNKIKLKQYLVGGLIGAVVALAVSIPTILLLNSQAPAVTPSELTEQTDEQASEHVDGLVRPQPSTNPIENENTSKAATATKSANNETTSDNSGAKQKISLDEAKKKALKHAGISSSQATFTKANLEYDDGRAEYEIDFVANNKEYDYTIDASTGAIIEYDVEGFETY